MTSRLFRSKLALVLSSTSVLALSACGGSSGSAATITPPSVETPPEPVSSSTFVTVTGEIDGFGSVIINGTRYDTDSADVKIDGEDASLSDLSVGQTVALRARRNAEGELPTALRVRYEEVLEGPVESIAADRRSLIILGQTVFLTEDTVFEDDLNPALIVVDDVLEISGSFTADGDIVASYVEVSDNIDGDFEVHGTVGGLNEGNQTFRIQGLRVGFASAALEDFEDGNVLSNGDKVEVEGSVFANDGTLIATRVEYEGNDLDELRGDEADDVDEEEVEIEGFITSFVSAAEFEVNGQAVITNSETSFERCSADSLGLDVEVEVEGDLNENGVLVADEVKCEVSPSTFITAAVDAVDVAAGTVTVLGVTFETNIDTSFQDKDSDRVRNFGLDDISVGDILRVQAYQLAESDILVAKKIRRERADSFDAVELKGDVSEFGDQTLTVAGVVVTLSGTTEFEIEDEGEVTRDAFFARAVLGDRLEIEGTEDENGTLIATEVELDLERDADDRDGDDD